MRIILVSVLNLLYAALVYGSHRDISITTATRDIFRVDREINDDLTNKNPIQKEELAMLIGTLFDLESIILRRLEVWDIKHFSRIYEDVYNPTIKSSIAKYKISPKLAYLVYKKRRQGPVYFATQFSIIISKICKNGNRYVSSFECDARVKDYAKKIGLKEDYDQTNKLGTAAKEFLRIHPKIHEISRFVGGVEDILMKRKDFLRPLIYSLVSAKI